jgi:DNA-binding NarL/FixJ family response regulator
MIRVFLADDHPIVREGLKRILSETSDISIVGEADSGKEVLRALQNQTCDVLLLDLSMPGKNGMEVLKQLRISHPYLPVLILSIHPEDQYALRVLKAGAAGYITKESAPDTLIQAIRKVQGGRRYISETVAERLASSVGKDPNKEPHELLSDREFQIFSMIAAGKKTSEIAEELHLSVKTIATYRSRIIEKMNLSSNSDLMRYAIKTGLVD